MAILEIKNVYYRYADAEENEYVLKKLNYQFEKGKCYAIKGKSGSGKTTLLSLLSGLENPTSGQILFKDKPLDKMNLDTYRSHNIGIIFQSFNLLPHLTALENVLLSINISKVKTENPQKFAEELLNKLGIKKAMVNRRVLKLSGGEQQRVAIIQILS